jgi:hypothetical protein
MNSGDGNNHRISKVWNVQINDMYDEITSTVVTDTLNRRIEVNQDDDDAFGSFP